MSARAQAAYSPARAVLNILKDVGVEKSHLLDTQKALINMLDDFNSEKERLLATQKALLSILDDLARILPPNEVDGDEVAPGPTGAHARDFFTAVVSRSIDGIRLLPDPGPRRRVRSRTGETLLDCETRNQLDAKEGDFLIVFGPSIAETVGARVMTVSDGTLLVQLVAGDLEAGTRSVQVMKTHPKGSQGVKRGEA